MFLGYPVLVFTMLLALDSIDINGCFKNQLWILNFGALSTLTLRNSLKLNSNLILNYKLSFMTLISLMN